MKLEQAVAILEEFNRWRRGEEIPQPDPRQIGIAIDTVLANVGECTCTSDNYGYGHAKCYDCGRMKG